MVEWTLLLYKYVTWISIFFCTMMCLIVVVIQIILDLFICMIKATNTMACCYYILYNATATTTNGARGRRAYIEIHNNIFHHFDLRVHIKQVWLTYHHTHRIANVCRSIMKICLSLDDMWLFLNVYDVCFYHFFCSISLIQPTLPFFLFFFCFSEWNWHAGHCVTKSKFSHDRNWNAL